MNELSARDFVCVVICVRFGCGLLCGRLAPAAQLASPLLGHHQGRRVHVPGPKVATRGLCNRSVTVKLPRYL